MGFLGNLTVHVRFKLGARREFCSGPFLFRGDGQPTVLNLTNHAYFNLSDDATTSVMGDAALINADNYTSVNQGGIPTGAVEPVHRCTPYDFRTLHLIGDKAPERGYDSNFRSSIDYH